MNDENVKKMLEKAFPDTPSLFHDRMADVKEGKTGHQRRLGKIALVCALALMVCGGAVAAMTHYGVFNFNPGFSDDYYFTLPGAEKMIHYNLAEEKTGGLTWKVKEAAYDGRVLRVLYSVTAPGMEITEDGIDGALADMHRKYGVSLECEGTGEIFVNGQGVNLSTTDYKPGQNPGEIEGWFDCKMEGYETDGYVKPQGEITVSMPFRYDNDDLKAQNPAGLEFTMDAGDAADSYVLALPEPCTLDTGAVAVFTDLHFSPVTVFMDVEITLPKGREESLPRDQQSLAFLDALEAIPEYQVFWEARMENEKGEALGAVRDGEAAHRFDGQGRLVLVNHYEFAPSDQYTAVNYLCLGDTWKLPIPMVYQEKTPAETPAASSVANE